MKKKKIKIVERLIKMIDSLDTIIKKMVMFEKLDKTIVDLMSKSSDSNNLYDICYKLIDLTGRTLELDKRISKIEKG